MSDIRYICLSDLHFGAYNSLFTYVTRDGIVKPERTTETLINFLNILEHIINLTNKKKKARFILNGDIFELALANTNQAVMAFDSFINLAYIDNRKEFFSDKVIFIAGNHDHHLWETARERQYLDYISKVEPGTFIEPPWHHTKMIRPFPLKSRFITTIMQRHKNLKDARALAVYPNLTLINRGTEKYVVITHGHFTEPIYTLMSNLISILLKSKSFPETIDEIEKENFAWIDFFWSVLGRSGKVGEGIGIIYDMLQNEKSINYLVNNLVLHFVNKTEIPDSVSNMFNPVITYFLTKTISNFASSERGLNSDTLGKESQKGLISYIKGPLKLQFLKENKSVLPQKMDFIFGHTHKPFARKYNGFEEFGYPDEIGIYNTGGWVIDTIQPQEQVGGAITLIDEDKNVVLLKFFKETNLKFVLESTDGQSQNPLLIKLQDKLNFNSSIFIQFLETLSKEIEIKRNIIQYRIIE